MSVPSEASRTETGAEPNAEVGRILLTELVRLLAAAPEAVTLDGVAASGKDFLLTLQLPQAMLAEVVGMVGTSEAPYLVLTGKGGASELRTVRHSSMESEGDKGWPDARRG